LTSGRTAAGMRDRGSLRASPVVLVVLAISLIWISITAHLYQERLESERAAADTTGNLARGFGENVERTIEGVDQVMKVLRNAYAVDPAAFDLTRLVPGNEILNAVTLQIAASDRHGMMTASNLPNATLVDLSDREHIKAQLDTNADELYISIPVFGRVSKQWSLQFTRKMFAQDGSLAGVLIISLDPYYLSRFYGTLEIGKGSITLLGIGEAPGSTARRSEQYERNLSVRLALISGVVTVLAGDDRPDPCPLVGIGNLSDH